MSKLYAAFVDTKQGTDDNANLEDSGSMVSIGGVVFEYEENVLTHEITDIRLVERKRVTFPFLVSNFSCRCWEEYWQNQRDNLALLSQEKMPTMYGACREFVEWIRHVDTTYNCRFWGSDNSAYDFAAVQSIINYYNNHRTKDTVDPASDEASYHFLFVYKGNGKYTYDRKIIDTDQFYSSILPNRKYDLFGLTDAAINYTDVVIPDEYEETQLPDDDAAYIGIVYLMVSSAYYKTEEENRKMVLDLAGSLQEHFQKKQGRYQKLLDIRKKYEGSTSVDPCDALIAESKEIIELFKKDLGMN